MRHQALVLGGTLASASRGAGDELDRLISAFNDMTSRLDSSFEQIRQFSTDVSHELRTPLNAILGMTNLAIKRDPAPKVAEYLDKIRVSARMLADIIEDVLDLSRIEAGSMHIERVDFDLDDLLADLSNVVGVRAGQKNVEILFAGNGENVFDALVLEGRHQQIGAFGHAAPLTPDSAFSARCGSVHSGRMK